MFSFMRDNLIKLHKLIHVIVGNIEIESNRSMVQCYLSFILTDHFSLENKCMTGFKMFELKFIAKPHILYHIVNLAISHACMIKVSPVELIKNYCFQTMQDQLFHL